MEELLIKQTTLTLAKKIAPKSRGEQIKAIRKKLIDIHDEQLTLDEGVQAQQKAKLLQILNPKSK